MKGKSVVSVTCALALVGPCFRTVASVLHDEGSRMHHPVAEDSSHTRTIVTCSAGYTQRGDYCYALQAEAPSWNAAQAQCQADGGWLADIFDQDENDWVWDTYGGDGKLLIGYNRFGGGIVNSRSASIPLCYQNWGYNQPDNKNGEEGCVEMRAGRDGTWNDVRCSGAGPPICKKLLDPSFVEAQDSSICSNAQTIVTCSAGYTQRGDYCYAVQAEAASWDAAQAQCHADGGWLADIFDQDENDWLWDTYGDRTLFIGYNRVAGEIMNSRNSNSNTTIPLCYQNWEATQPDNKNGQEGCVEMKSGRGGQWNDLQCGAVGYPLCKKPLDVTSSAGETPSFSTPQPSLDPSASPSSAPSASPTFSAALLLNGDYAFTTGLFTSGQKQYYYAGGFGVPILQYRPNRSFSAKIGTASPSSYIGNNQYAVIDGDGPCKKAGGESRDGVLTLACGASETVTVDELSVCNYEVLWTGPQWCPAAAAAGGGEGEGGGKDRRRLLRGVRSSAAV